MEIRWIKITTDIFDDEKIKLIDSIPDRDAILVIWFKLLTLAGKKNANGMVFLSNKVPYTDEMLATIFNRPLNTVRLALQTFQTFDMIEITDNKIITVKNWEKHQNVDGLNKIREQNKIRQQNYRKRLKNEEKGLCNITSRYHNETEEDKEEEKNRIDKNKKEKKKKSYEDVFLGMKVSDNLKNSLKDFIDTRKSMKAPMTVRALELAILKLRKLSNSEITQIAIIEQSIMNGYKGLFELKETKQTPMQRNQDFGNDAEWDAIDIQEQEKTKNGQLF